MSNILAEYFPVEENQQKKILREAIPPSPFYEVPIYFFPDHFLIEKKDDFEGCLKGVDGCFKGV